MLQVKVIDIDEDHFSRNPYHRRPLPCGGEETALSQELLMSFFSFSVNRWFKITCLILAFSLESCISLYTGRWTHVNLGGVLQCVEYERPCKKKVQDDSGQWRYHTHVWKKGERYIVEVPIAFVPYNPPLIEHSAGHCPAKKSLDNRYWGAQDEEIAQYPAELYYADLSHAQFTRLYRIHKSDLLGNPYPGLKLIPASEMDFSGATLIPDAFCGNEGTCRENPDIRSPHLEIISLQSIPPRRSTLNYCLQPISLIARVVDIPLTLIATPIGWVADALYESFNN